MMVKIAPSLLAADFGDLKNEVQKVEKAGAEYLHLDIMDGHFVPNISFGPGIVKALRDDSNLFFDVHLMIEKPENYIGDFVKAGADLICVHAEACPHLHRVLQIIKGYGVKAAVALNPATPVSALENVLEELDMVLIMAVNPGFGGQKFLPLALNKIRSCKQMICKSGAKIDIQVDGGICSENAGAIAKAGADILVAGSAVFAQKDPAKAVSKLKIMAEFGCKE